MQQPLEKALCLGTHHILLLSKAEDYESKVSSEILLPWQEMGGNLLSLKIRHLSLFADLMMAKHIDSKKMCLLSKVA